MRQLLLRPELPSCEDCKMYWYDHDWQPVTDTEGKICERPKPVTEEDCRFCDKKQFGFQDLEPHNWQCWDNFNRAIAVGATEEELADGRFCHNTAMLKMLKDNCDRQLNAKLQAELICQMFSAVAR